MIISNLTTFKQHILSHNYGLFILIIILLRVLTDNSIVSRSYINTKYLLAKLGN